MSEDPHASTRSYPICGFEIGRLSRLLIAGPCAIFESQQMAIDTAGVLKELTGKLGSIPFIYKSSFDKANRSSSKSFRGMGMDFGLKVLSEVRAQVGVPVLTDVHETEQARPVADVVAEMSETPAFLCRQTDFIRACAATLKPVNIKKGQFLAPHDMINVVAKAREAAIEAGGDGGNILVCERGASFGYNNLVSDMRSLAIMRETDCPVVFDATHSVQLPGGQGTTSGGSVNSCRCWRGRRWPWACRACSWKRTRIRPMPSPTGPMWFRWRAWATCWHR